MAGSGMFNAWGGGLKGAMLGVNLNGDLLSGAGSKGWCDCPECTKLSQESNSEKFQYQTNKQVRDDAYNFVRRHFGPDTLADFTPVHELLTQFVLRQLQVREQYYQRRFQDIRLEHSRQLEGFMKREKVLAKMSGEEASAKHSVPDTKGRLFREGEEKAP